MSERVIAATARRPAGILSPWSCPADQIGDLTAIQYRLGEVPAAVSLTRTVDAFINLIGAVCSSGRPLRIQLEKNTRPDPMSLDVMHLLQAKYRKTLEVIIK